MSRQTPDFETKFIIMPSKIAHVSHFQKNLEESLRNLKKEGDFDPWTENDYIPDETEQGDISMKVNLYNQVSEINQNQNLEILNQSYQENALNRTFEKNQIFNNQIQINNTIPHQVKGQKQQKSANLVNDFDEEFQKLSKKIANNQLSTNQINNAQINELLEGNFLPKKKKLTKQIKQNRVQKKTIQLNRTTNKENELTYNEKELAQCTFTPKINSKLSSKRRTFDEFLENQSSFIQKKENKRQQLRIQQENSRLDSFKYNPQINQKSRILAENKPLNNISVHERLYTAKREQLDSTENQQNQNSQYLNENVSTFKPNIHDKSRQLIRTEKIENILYRDALRRQEKKFDSKSTQEQQRQFKLVNEETEKILVKKFIKEFIFSLQEVNQNSQRFLDYINLSEVLKSLGFINFKKQQNSEGVSINEEKTLLYDMWNYLIAEKDTKEINYFCICKFLLIVLGLPYNFDYEQFTEFSDNFFPEKTQNKSVIEVTKQNEEQQIQEQQTNSFNQSNRKIEDEITKMQNWDISDEDARKIQKDFNLFYRNRLVYQNQKKQRQDKNYDFQPEISETSKVLAAHYRERLLEEAAVLIENKVLDVKIPENGKISHIDLLVLQKKAQKVHHQKLKSMKEQKELNGCTFKPSTSNFQKDQVRKNQTNQTMENQQQQDEQNNPLYAKDRNIELYQMAKAYNQQKDRDPNEIEYEKQIEECTFQPDIQPFKNQRIYEERSIYQVKDVDKALERMKQGREIREYEKMWKERGIPLQFYKNNNNIRNESYQGFHENSLNDDQYEQQQISGQMYNNNNNKNIKKNKNLVNEQLKYQRTANLQQQMENMNNFQSENIQMKNFINMNQQEDQNIDLQQQEYQNQQYIQNYQQTESEQNLDTEKSQQQNIQKQDYYSSDQDHFQQQNQQEWSVQNLQNQRENDEFMSLEKQIELSEQQEEDNFNTQHEIQDTAEDQSQEQDENHNERIPLLFVDVNLGPNKSERIVVYDGDNSEDLANRFSEYHGLDDVLKGKLKQLLDIQIAGLLCKIDEEEQNSSDDEKN